MSRPFRCPLCLGKGTLHEPKNRTKFIRELVLDFDVPQELLVCEEHHRWLVAIDPLFPYHWELNRCDRCK